MIIAAAKVGGILANKKFKGNLYENLNSNQHNSCSLCLRCKKINFLRIKLYLSKFSNQPIKERYLLTDKLERPMMHTL